ncbi:L-rhamnose mutarotase [soil metagenome]
MKTIAFKMKLRPGSVDEYKRRHAAIWPELVEVLKENGISDYTIFLDAETDTLFAVQKQNGSQTSQDLGEHPLVKKWWDYMSDLMIYEYNKSPVAIFLEPVFHMD